MNEFKLFIMQVRKRTLASLLFHYLAITKS